MWHCALPRLWRERKELSVSGACSLPLIAGQYAQVEIKRGLYCPRLLAARRPAQFPPRVTGSRISGTSGNVPALCRRLDETPDTCENGLSARPLKAPGPFLFGRTATEAALMLRLKTFNKAVVLCQSSTAWPSTAIFASRRAAFSSRARISTRLIIWPSGRHPRLGKNGN